MSSKLFVLQKNNETKRYFESLNDDEFMQLFMNYIHDELIRDYKAELQTPSDFLQQIQYYQPKNNTKKTPPQTVIKCH